MGTELGNKINQTISGEKVERFLYLMTKYEGFNSTTTCTFFLSDISPITTDQPEPEHSW